jgi:hypothetical protein
LQGPSLESLADLEQELLDSFGALKLAELAGRSSLLGLLAADPKLQELLTGSSGGAAALQAGGATTSAGSSAGGQQITEQELLVATYACLQARQGNGAAGASSAQAWEDEATCRAVSGALCAHYGVAAVQDLGHGRVERLVSSALQAGSSVRGAVLQHAAALTCAHPQHLLPPSATVSSGSTGTSSELQQQEVQLALAALASAQELAPLHSCLSWPSSFQACCGPLPAFVLQHSSHLQAADLSFLQLPGGDCIKVPTSCNIDSFRAAVTAQDAAAAVGQVLGLVAQHGSVGAAPTAELRHITATCLVAMAGQDR